jgi:hypothetical protein
MSETVTTQEEQPVGLSLSDLQLAKQIIEVSAQRGGIRAEEMEVVGALHTRLGAFIQASLPEEETAEEEATSEE